MNALLWRSEMSGARNAGSAIPINVVWNRILTAPDDSSLQILHRGQKIGFCRWAATIVESSPGGERVHNVGEEPAAGADSEVEGRVLGVAGYVLDLEGSVVLEDTPQRLRFTARLEFDRDQAWRTLFLRLNLKTQLWELRAEASSESVTLRSEGAGGNWERRFTLADLGRPETLMSALGLPGSLGWLGAVTAAQGPALDRKASLALGLRWEARTDWLEVGHSPIRVHRIEARLFDKYRVAAYVSRVGELLRVEFPEDVALVNEALASF